ncbi:MAG: fatty acid desaturase family protein [Pseudobdellovibrionaceae bacterium]
MIYSYLDSDKNQFKKRDLTMGLQGSKNFKVRYSPGDHFLADVKLEVDSYLQKINDHRYGNWEQIFKLLLLLLVWGIGFSIVISAGQSIWHKLSGTVFMAVSSLLLVFNVCHDAVHNSWSKNKNINYWINTILFSLMGMNGYLWGYRHIHAHHPYTNIDRCDPDIQENPFVRLSAVHPYRWYFKYQHIYAPFLYLFAIPHSIFWQDFERLKEKKILPLVGVVHSKIEWLFFFLAKTIYFSIYIFIPVAFGRMTFLEATILLLVMQMTTSLMFVGLLAVNHFGEESEFPVPDKAGLLNTSFSLHQLKTSTDWYPRSRFWCFWFGGANSHIAHHLFPKVSHRHYHVIASIIRSKAIEYNYPYREVSLIGAIVTHYRFLKKLGLNSKKPIVVMPQILKTSDIL